MQCSPNITINSDPFNRLTSSIWQVIFMREHVKRWKSVEVVMDSERVEVFSVRSPSQGCSVQREREMEMPFLECLKLKFVYFGGYNFYLDSHHPSYDDNHNHNSNDLDHDLNLFANAPRLRHVSIIDNAGCMLGNPATQADGIFIIAAAAATTTTTTTTTTISTTSTTTIGNNGNATNGYNGDNHTEAQAQTRPRGFTFILPRNQLEKLECGGRFIPQPKPKPVPNLMFPVPPYTPTPGLGLGPSVAAAVAEAEGQGIGQGQGDMGVDVDMIWDDYGWYDGYDGYDYVYVTHAYPAFANLTELSYTLDIPSMFFSAPAPTHTHPHSPSPSPIIVISTLMPTQIQPSHLYQL
ncbi:hypothetical protein D9758_013973 [Tetrapyrgos nigripes]|uniref:Uncharacterized protein n=1 Tax=Tetrapyrgos nigripes TaxID=182062 RepID=A0A8H5G7X6_9AGAR|nr:hypothetical protein D9758_013973 [Tetrapyrgos nigripes]